MCNRPHLSSATIGLFYGSPLRLRPLPIMDPLSISPVMQFDAIRCHCDAMRFPQPKPYLPDRDRVPMVQRSSRVSASTMHKGKSITAPYTAHRRISESTSTRICFPAPIVHVPDPSEIYGVLLPIVSYLFGEQEVSPSWAKAKKTNLLLPERGPPTRR